MLMRRCRFLGCGFEHKKDRVPRCRRCRAGTGRDNVRSCAGVQSAERETLMQESLLVGVRVIVPLIVFMGLGYLFRSLKFAKEQTFRELNKICFRSFLPVMVFYNIYQSDLKEDFEAGVLLYAVLSILIIFLSAVLIVNRVWKGDRSRSVIVQGMYRSNFVLIGIEVTRTVCGADQLGMASILVSVIIPIYNVLAVLLFTFYGEGKKSAGSVALSIIKNPLIISVVLGILVNVSGFALPELAENIVDTMSSAATPLALVCLGGTFAFGQIRTYRKELAAVTLARLVFVPLIFVCIAVLIGCRGSNLVALMVMYGSPAAISSYTMAAEMGGNHELAGAIVVVTSIVSVLTIFLWVVALHFLGLIS